MPLWQRRPRAGRGGGGDRAGASHCRRPPWRCVSWVRYRCPWTSGGCHRGSLPSAGTEALLCSLLCPFLCQTQFCHCEAFFCCCWYTAAFFREKMVVENSPEIFMDSRKTRRFSFLTIWALLSAEWRVCILETVTSASLQVTEAGVCRAAKVLPGSPAGVCLEWNPVS